MDVTRQRAPWSVDRWGRLIVGSSILGFILLGWLVDRWWFLGNLAVAANLIVTSLTGYCPLNRLLIRLGAREREEIFRPDGSLRQPTEHPEPPGLKPESVRIS